jgi:hypothetical protein
MIVPVEGNSLSARNAQNRVFSNPPFGHSTDLLMAKGPLRNLEFKKFRH